jgi:hypothetical protein
MTRLNIFLFVLACTLAPAVVVMGVHMLSVWMVSGSMQALAGVVR